MNDDMNIRPDAQWIMAMLGSLRSVGIVTEMAPDGSMDVSLDIPRMVAALDADEKVMVLDLLNKDSSLEVQEMPMDANGEIVWDEFMTDLAHNDIKHDIPAPSMDAHLAWDEFIEKNPMCDDMLAKGLQEATDGQIKRMVIDAAGQEQPGQFTEEDYKCQGEDCFCDNEDCQM